MTTIFNLPALTTLTNQLILPVVDLTTSPPITKKVTIDQIVAASIGPTGPRGPTGPQGPIGQTGLGFAIVKIYTSLAQLTADTAPTGIVAGQFATIDTGNVADADNAKLYLWNGTAYTYVTDLSGASGLVGPTGSQGNIGSTGPQGSIGPTGPIGLQGPTGAINTSTTLTHSTPSVAIDLTKQLALLEDSDSIGSAKNYTLADGVEGQLMYFAWKNYGSGVDVPQQVNLNIIIEHARLANDGETNPWIVNNYLWTPFNKIEGTARSAAGATFAIFTNGAWVLSRQP